MKQIALIYPITVAWMGEFFLGLANYAQEHGQWSILTSPPTLTGAGENALTLNNLQGWPGDGVITAITNHAQFKAAQALHLPFVNISGALHNPPFPTVTLDHYLVGRMAADHLLKCGFRRLAYYGIKKLWYSQQRRLGFQSRAQEAGISVDVYEEVPVSERTIWPQRVAGLHAWLRTLTSPIGLLAVHDYRARVVIDECQRLGIIVPHDLAVIGVDNDPVVCEYCRPTLSSVARGGFRHGQEVAQLLDQLMAGKPAGKKPVLVPPTCVIMRNSTDTITVADPHVTTVIRYMHQHLGESFGVKQLLRLVPISRRRLENQFRRYLRCTPYEYLSWIRVEKAKQLLRASPPMKIKEIAVTCGYPNPVQFRTVFKRLSGQSPRQYASLYLDQENPLANVESKIQGAPAPPFVYESDEKPAENKLPKTQ